MNLDELKTDRIGIYEKFFIDKINESEIHHHKFGINIKNDGKRFIVYRNISKELKFDSMLLRKLKVMNNRELLILTDSLVCVMKRLYDINIKRVRPDSL